MKGADPKHGHYQAGGDMISSVTFEKTLYKRLPYKFEAGTPHVAGISVEGQIDNRTKQAQEVVRMLTGHPPLNPVVAE